MLRNKIKVQSKQQEHKNAGGRTMTEMLGTLAIIGVLSIGGVAGYSYAMDKYRANVTINDINLRAGDLIIQSTRNIPFSLGEWGQTSTAGYTFNSFGETDDGMLFLEISGIPKGVCNMVVATLGEQFDMDINGERIDVSDECGLSDSNIITVYFEGSGSGVTCNPACKDGEVCEFGICINEELEPTTAGPLCSSDEDCPECRICGVSWAGTNNCYDPQPNGTACTGGTCSNGECVAGECSSNSDCATNFFCAYTNDSCESAHPSICQKLNFIRKMITVNGNTETWYGSNRYVSWWDAQSACDKMGKTMATVNELVSGWSGSTGDFTLTERALKLYDAFGNNYVWTSDIRSDSRYAFKVDLSYGSVGYRTRNCDYYLALCH